MSWIQGNKKEPKKGYLNKRDEEEKLYILYTTDVYIQ